ncbi:hypothetical protein ES702_02770 [subsurface metagenome]
MSFVDDLGLGSFSFSQSWEVMMWIFWFVIIIAIGLCVYYYFFLLLKYKHKFRIFDVTNGVEVVSDDKARISTGKDGVLKWNLRFRKINAPAPPDWAKKVTNKGKFSVMARYSDTKGFEYINPSDLQNQISQEELTTNQKIFMIAEYKKSKLEAPKNMGTMIREAVPYMALVIIVVCMFVFWGEITQPSLDMAKTNAAVTTEIKEIVSDLKEIKSNQQTLQPARTKPPE